MTIVVSGADAVGILRLRTDHGQLVQLISSRLVELLAGRVDDVPGHHHQARFDGSIDKVACAAPHRLLIDGPEMRVTDMRNPDRTHHAHPSSRSIQYRGR